MGTGSLSVARYRHTATLLANGQVLMTGGHDTNTTDFSNGIGDTAELYDPTSGNFTMTGSLLVGRVAHTATLVPGGKVVVIGGHNASGTFPVAVELYDPGTGMFTQSGNLLSAGRVYHTATLLGNGKVLVAGGRDYNIGPVASAELYDPTTGTFTSTGSMSAARSYHTATLLTNGQVLVTGGLDNIGALASAELYDPSTGLFTLTGSTSVGRVNHAATLLANGQVLVTGGAGSIYDLDSAELYDPNAGTFTATGNMSVFRQLHTATLLTNGQVLVAGGHARSSAELYDPSTGTFTPTSSMSVARGDHSATLLNNGRVLVAGGVTPCVIKPVASAQLFAVGMGCPVNILVVTCSTNVSVTWSIVTPMDFCSPVTVTSSPPSGSFFNRDSTNTVTAIAADACGHTNSCTFDVIVRRPERLSLSVALGCSPGTVTLTWADGGLLQRADDILGPWTDVAGPPVSPYTISVAPLPKQFFRLRCP